MKAVEKYNARVVAVNSLLCVGLDSDMARLPEAYRSKDQPQFEFNRWVIEQTHTFAAAYKLNSAFYEARGAAGMQELKLTLNYLRDRHPEILTICDAKRGDIGDTSDAYARAIFDELGADAVTLSPYLGKDSLQPFLDRADKGCIILCRTSNEGANELQNLQVDGKPLWQIVAEKVANEWNANGNCMLVAGATYPAQLLRIRNSCGEMTFLVPGVGAQGGDVQATVQAGINRSGKGLIINASRSIIQADFPGDAAQGLRDNINQYR